MSIFSSGGYLVQQLYGRGHYKEFFSEIIVNLSQWFRRCHLKIFFLILAGILFVYQSGTICAILVEGIYW